MDDVDRLIKGAIESGERITIIYFGGSTPGQPREIEPISLAGDKLRALCVASQTIKSFSLSKIRTSLSHEPPHSYTPTKHLDTYPSFAAFRDHYLPALERQGFALSSGDHFIHVHDRFKNGKPRKSVAVGISFQRLTSDLLFDENTGEVVAEERERARPWSVTARGGTTRAFKDAQAAQLAFLALIAEIPATS